MKVKSFLLLVVCGLFLVACSTQTYDIEEVVATLDDEDIKVKDIISQYPLTEENIKFYLLQEIIKSKVQEKSVTISEEELENFNMLFFNEDRVDEDDFNKKEAKALGMDHEEYIDMWSKKQIEGRQYFHAFIENELGEPSSDADLEEWTKEIDAYITNLYNEYLEDGRLIVY